MSAVYTVYDDKRQTIATYTSEATARDVARQLTRRTGRQHSIQEVEQSKANKIIYTLTDEDDEKYAREEERLSREAQQLIRERPREKPGTFACGCGRDRRTPRRTQEAVDRAVTTVMEALRKVRR